MTTVRSVPPELASEDADGGPGDRLRRRRRRRLVREELLTVFVLLLALTATLVVLGFQWLDSGQTSSSSAGSSGPAGAAIHNTLGGHT
jgi:hypothetical protein